VPSSTSCSVTVSRCGEQRRPHGVVDAWTRAAMRPEGRSRR
jgi:hypothetical protein